MKRIHLYIIVLSISLASCISSSVTSNKSSDFNVKINKVFITMRGVPQSNTFFKSFQTALSDEFNLRNIEYEFHIFEELSLQTDEDLINEINEFNPQVIMVINQTERRITRGRIGGRPGATFDIKIFQPDYNSILWRASLKVDTFSDLGEGTKKALKKLIEKMNTDGII